MMICNGFLLKFVQIIPLGSVFSAEFQTELRNYTDFVLNRGVFFWY